MTISAKMTDFRNYDGQRLYALALRHLPTWISVILVIALGWQAARLVWLLVPGRTDAVLADVPAAQAAAANAASPAAGANVQIVADAHLFGEAKSDDGVVVPVQNVENLEETRLSLTLMGTIASTDDEDAIAIIADPRNDEKIYSLGDTVTQGATLHAVYPDRVVLNRSGALEVLKLPREFPKNSAATRRSVSRPAARAEPDEGSERSIQTVVSQNVTKLADVIRPTPYFVAGQQQGYRVYPGRDRRQFAALGLRPGDLIKDIDGAALTDPQQAMQIFQSLGTAEQVSVTVERNGQPQVLVLNTNQLDLDNDDVNDK